jgi:uncharacterized protein YjiS (DUF1127 family)
MTTIVANTFNWIGLESIANFFVKLNEQRIRRKQINQTIKELSALDDRALNDMGLTRGDIYTVAHGMSDVKRVSENNNLKGWV